MLDTLISEDGTRMYKSIKREAMNQSKTLFNFDFVDSKIANISEEDEEDDTKTATDHGRAPERKYGIECNQF